MSLPASLSDPALLRLWDVLPGARVVGGAVRDGLAGRLVADIDLATPWTPSAVMKALEAAGLRAIPTGLSHGTVTALSAGRPFEVTTLRRDVATDGRHAVVAFTDDWRADAARRDFTFNAMSQDRAGALYDYYGGAADLAAGTVRFVGEPAERIAEDTLRVLRYFRFFGRFGRGRPDPATERAIRGALPHLPALSAERVWAELGRILRLDDPLPTLRLMQDLGVLAVVLPGPATLAVLSRLVAAGGPDDALLRLAALSEAAPDRLAETYRLSSAEAERLQRLRGAVPADDATDLALRQAAIDCGRSALIDRAWLAGRSAATRARIAALPELVFPVQGRDLLALGLPPGPELGRRLARLRCLWRDGGGTAGRGELLAQLAPPPGG